MASVITALSRLRHHEVSADVIKVLANRLALLAIGLLTSVITARFLGAAGRGLYSLLLQAGTLVMSIFGGLSVSIAYVASKHPTRLKHVLPNATFMATVLGLFGAAVLLAYMVLSRLPVLYYGYAVNLVFLMLNLVWSSIFLGLGDIKNLTLNSIVLSVVGAAFLGLFVVVLKWGVPGALYAGLLAQTVVLVAFARVVHRQTPSLYSWYCVRISIIKYLAAAGAKASLSNFIGTLNSRLDYWYVSYILSLSQLGMYTVAVAAAEMLTVLGAAFQNALYGRLGKLDSVRSLRLLHQAIIAYLVSIGMVAILYVAGLPVFVRLLYGNEFLSIVPITRFLIVEVALKGVYSLLTTYFYNQKMKPEIVGVANVIQLVVTAVVGILAIPRMKLVGAALSLGVSQFAGILFLVGVLWAGNLRRRRRVSWFEEETSVASGSRALP